MFRTSVGGVDILRIPLRGPTGPSSEISCFTWEDAPENLRSRIHMDSPNLQFKHAETIAWICLDPVSWSPAHSCPAADCYIFLWVSSTFHPMRMIFLRRSFGWFHQWIPSLTPQVTVDTSAPLLGRCAVVYPPMISMAAEHCGKLVGKMNEDYDWIKLWKVRIC